LSIDCKEPLSAVEIRIVTFDVWGQRMWTLYGSQVTDLKVGMNNLESMRWYFTEHDVSGYYASIAYIARVRTAAGRIIDADPLPVIDEARKFSAKFAPSDLEKSEPGQKVK
jgi:hypothetical protein